MSDATNDAQLAVAVARLASLADDMAEVKTTMKTLAAAVTKLAVIEERQTADRGALERAFAEIGKLDGRVKALEQAQPLQKQASDWVQKAVGLVLAAVIGAGISTVVRAPEPKAPPVQHEQQRTSQ